MRLIALALGFLASACRGRRFNLANLRAKHAGVAAPVREVEDASQSSGHVRFDTASLGHAKAALSSMLSPAHAFQVSNPIHQRRDRKHRHSLVQSGRSAWLSNKAPTRGGSPFMYEVTLIDPDTDQAVVYECSSGQTFISEALAQGIKVPHRCVQGSCNVCVAKVLEGKVRRSDPYEMLETEDRKNGFLLTCMSTPMSDCTILLKQQDELENGDEEYDYYDEYEYD